MTIAVAVSGGADSLYAMASLQREYPGQVIAFHALQKETLPEDDPVPGLEASCRALGVPLHILDLQEAFSGRSSGLSRRVTPTGKRPTRASAAMRW